MLISLIIFSIFLYVWWKFRDGRKNINLPPEYPNKWSLIGSIHSFAIGNTRHALKLFERIAEQCIQMGGVSQMKLGPLTYVGVVNPDDAFTVLSSCLHKNKIYGFAKPWLGEGLANVTTNLAHWKRHRKIINRVFNQKVLDGYMGIFNNQSRRLVEDLSKEVNRGPFEHLALLEDCFLKIIMQTALGCDESEITVLFDNNLKTAVQTMFQVLAQRFLTVWLHSEFIFKFTDLKKRQDESVAIMQKTTNAVIKRKQEILQKSPRDSTKFSSILDLLLELPPSEAFTNKEIEEEVNTFIAAGSDTSATILTFTLMLLGSHEDIQDKVYEEIKQVFEESTRDVNKQDLTKLTYMEAMLLESIRLYPILPMLPRSVVEDVKLRNCTIPAGSTCFVFVRAIHRDPNVWGSDAADFRPERWLTPGALPSSPGAYAGFSLGKRGCIGKVQAMMSLKTSLVHILRHYRISADISKLELQIDSLLKPASGCQIALELRK